MPSPIWGLPPGRCMYPDAQFRQRPDVPNAPFCPPFLPRLTTTTAGSLAFLRDVCTEVLPQLCASYKKIIKSINNAWPCSRRRLPFAWQDGRCRNVTISRPVVDGWCQARQGNSVNPGRPRAAWSCREGLATWSSPPLGRAKLRAVEYPAPWRPYAMPFSYAFCRPAGPLSAVGAAMSPDRLRRGRLA
jgi:hypothetical protein